MYETKKANLVCSKLHEVHTLIVSKHTVLHINKMIKMKIEYAVYVGLNYGVAKRKKERDILWDRLNDNSICSESKKFNYKNKTKSERFLNINFEESLQIGWSEQFFQNEQ